MATDEAAPPTRAATTALRRTTTASSAQDGTVLVGLVVLVLEIVGPIRLGAHRSPLTAHLGVWR